MMGFIDSVYSGARELLPDEGIHAMSSKTSLARLDLNLLIALDALLTERSVTRAAERLHLSQPALSASLARLRVHFDDVLLARQGNAYQLTPLAVRLSERTTLALEMTRRVFESQNDWSAGSSTREFSIYGSDYAFTTTGQTVSRAASALAPNVKFRFMLHSSSIVDDVENQLRYADALLLPHGFITNMPHVDLWHDRWVVIAADDNDAVRDGLTMDVMERSPWVFTYQSRTAFTSASRQLQVLGLAPRVEAVVETFLGLSAFVAGTPRLALVQAGLLSQIPDMGGIRVLEPPFDASPIINALWWHPAHTYDPEHTWMRELFQAASAKIADEQ